MERLLVTPEPCKTAGWSWRAEKGARRWEQPPATLRAHSLLTTTAALVDTCPCTFVATAE